MRDINKAKIRKANKNRMFIMLTIVLLMFSNIVPLDTLLRAESLDQSSVKKPTVTMDVEGKTHLEIEPEEDFKYNVHVGIPEDVENYTSLEIIDELDGNLSIQEATFLVDGKVDNRSNIKVKGQKVTSVISTDQLDELANETLTLEIIAQVNEAATSEQTIKNVAEVIVNDDLVLKTDPVQVSVAQSEEVEETESEEVEETESEEAEEEESEEVEETESEEVEETESEEVEETESEEAEETESEEVEETESEEAVETESEEVEETESEEAEEEESEEVEETESEEAEETESEEVEETESEEAEENAKEIDKTSEKKSTNQINNIKPLNNDGVTMNDTDFYAITTDGWLVQFEGDPDLINANNGQTWEKARVKANLKDGVNGLGKTSDGFYVTGNRGSGVRNLFKIDPDGTTTKVADGVSSASATMTEDGEKFVFMSDNTISIIDLNTSVRTNKTLYNTTNTPLEHKGNGDIIIDGEGYVWHATHGQGGSNLIRINIDTGEIDRIIPIKNANGGDLDKTAGIAFLNDGRIAMHSNSDGQKGGYILNPRTGQIEQQIYEGHGFGDYASTAFPIIQPDLDINKSVSPQTEVTRGEELTYTLIVENSGTVAATQTEIIDSLPDGVSYVEESTTLNGSPVNDVNGNSPLFSGMTVNSPGTDNGIVFVGEENKVLVTFKVKVDDEAKVGDEIINIASVSSAEIDEFDSNEVINKVVYKDPALKSTKSAVLKKKAEENDYEDNPNIDEIEVGDTVRYTITTNNTVEDSIVENLVITDEIPDGVTYVKGSVEASHGIEATYNNGVIKATFGDVTDREKRTVSFDVTVDEGQAEEAIENIAVVEGDNTDPDDPDEEVEVYPREPALEGEKSAVNKKEGKENFEVGDTIVYTIKGRNAKSDSLVIKNFTITDNLPEGLEFIEDSFEVSHDGKATYDEGVIEATFGDVKDTEWRTLTFKAIIKSGQSDTTIKNVATVEGDDVPPKKPKTEVPVDYKDPILDSTKSAALEKKAEKNDYEDNPNIDEIEVGDTVRYTITTNNTVEDSIVENLVITDEIPAGVTYVKDSVEASHDVKATYKDGVITANFGDVKDTEKRTVSFDVTVDKGQAGKDIENIAVVESDNTDPDEPEEEVEVYPREPGLEGKKSAVNKEEGKEDFEVGDTVIYTIEGRNTESDSLVKDFTITDSLPEGLEFVEDSFEVSHDGKATYDEGVIEATFGDVKDTDWREVTFEAIIKSGQSDTTIENVATVEGEGVPPTNPDEKIKVDPKDPNLEGKKSAINKEEGKEDFEVGDTVIYTIEGRNAESDSLVKDFTITDSLPEGLEFVEDSFEVSHDGKATYDEGVIEATFGDVKDTDWREVTFEAIIKSGQSDTTIENVATVEGEDTPPTNPDEKIKVDPKDPVLESNKVAELDVKAEGNTDEEQVEVGDTVRYTITTNNTIEDSIVENLVITDEIPAGVTYVEGSVEASHDAKATYKDGVITATFGDVIDTDDRTVTFLVTVDKGQAGEDIKNIAVVEGDNTDPDEPKEEVEVYPREPGLEGKKSAINKEEGKEDFEVGDTVIYTIEGRNTESDSLVKDFTITDSLPEGLEFVEDSFVVSHDGEATYDAGVIEATFGDVKDTDWREVTFEAIIKSGQSDTTIENIATVEGEDTPPTNPDEKIKVDPKDPVLKSNKVAELDVKAEGNTDEEQVEVGDTVRYTITTNNTVEDSLIENLIITDEIPAGVTYVEDSVEASHDVETTYKDGIITATFGDVTDTNDRTVTFLVTVDKGQSGKDIKNIAVVESDNTDPDEPKEEVEVYPREPGLEGKKSAVNKEEGKKDFEVGDTVIYTIEGRNTESDSLVKDFMITDSLPEGLEFVEDSFEVSHDGKATYDEGVIEATFGDVKDTDWREVTFEAIIKSGQSDTTIENVATVEGEDTPPTNPDEKIKVDPKDPVLKSNKVAELDVKAEGNTDEEQVEVGDTVRYTITTNNTVEDSLIENLVITDEIPAGVTYVEDSVEASHDVEAIYKDGVITATFGDVIDTDDRTVTFLVTVDKGQAGKNIENIAVVESDNTDPDKPEEEVEVYPREPGLEGKKSAVNKATGKEDFEVGDTVIYAIKGRNTESDSLVENFTISDDLPEGLEFVEDSMVVSHDGKATYDEGVIEATFDDVEDTEWRTVIFEAIIKSGQSGTTIKNVATVEGEDMPPTTPEKAINVDPTDYLLESNKVAELDVKAEGNTDEEQVEVGDTVRYTITTKNIIEDSLIENLVITDEIPAGVTYVEGSVEASHDAKATYKDGVITASFGDVTDTDYRTMTFLVTVDKGQAGENINNIAVVSGDNIDPDKPEEEVEVYPREPGLEGNKSAVNKEAGKEEFEVGDTVIYTIEGRNTATDSLVENFTISDDLPEGLEFIEGSLVVSHNGEATYDEGVIEASFGDVEDTEWRTVTFEAMIQSNVETGEIKNVAKITTDSELDTVYAESTIQVEQEEIPSPREEDEPVLEGSPTPPADSPSVDKKDPSTPKEGSKLPKTATTIFTFLLVGLLIMTIGLVSLRRKAKSE